MLDIMNIPIKVNALEYTDADLLVRYNIINETHKNKYADLDFLILNSTAMSGQYTKNKDEWRELIIKLNSKFKIAITEKVDDVLCTINDNLTVKDIAAISTRAKKIIAVNSGPATGLFNTYTLNNVDIIYTFSFNETYAHHKFSSKLDIKELYFLADA
jgi:RNase P/RNase MRP subunit p30